MKKILFVLFSISLFFSSIPTSAYASPNAQFIETIIISLDKYIESVETIAKINPKDSTRNILRKIDKTNAELSSLEAKQKIFVSSKNQVISNVAKEFYSLIVTTINELNEFESKTVSSSESPEQLKQAFLQNALSSFQKMTVTINNLSQLIINVNLPYMKNKNMSAVMEKVSSSGIPYLISEAERSSLLKLIDDIKARNEKIESSPISNFFLASALNKMRLMLGGGAPLGNSSLISLPR